MLTRFLIPALTSAALLLAGATRALAQAPCSDCPCAAKASDKLVQKVYPVADLLHFSAAVVSRPAGPSAASCCAKSAGCPACSSCPKTAAQDCPKGKCCPTCPECCDKCEQCDDCSGCPHCSYRKENSALETLIKLVRSTVAPQTWCEAGGCGKIEYYPLGRSLVVYQTPDVQEQIAALLESLRRQADEQVAVEVKFLRVRHPFFEGIGVRVEDTITLESGETVTRVGVDFTDPRPPVQSLFAGFLDDRQVKDLLQKAYGDQRTNCLQVPKLTVANGQTTGFQLKDQQYFVTRVQTVQAGGQLVYVPQNEPVETGTRLSVRPIISADRRYVALDLAVDHKSLVSTPPPLFPVTTSITPVFEGGAVGQPIPFTQFIQQPSFSTVTLNRTLIIPDGKTAVLGGWTCVRQESREEDVPVLSDLPIIGELFKNTEVSQENEYLFVLVTPRIIVPEEEEVRQTGCLESYPDPAVAQAPAYGDAEEQEVPPPAYKEYKAAKTVAAKGGEAKLAKLLKKYDQACAEGRRSEAQKLALKALLLDPTCFQSRSSSER